jgi:thiosulfate dehydrogenase
VDNVFSCATCHDLVPPADGAAIKAGAPLAGATLRPSFWGGQEVDLLAAINQCRQYFMIADAPLAADSREALALYDFLVGLEPGDPAPAPLTIVGTIEEVPRGDAAAGMTLFGRSCASCHGQARTGIGRIATRVPILPAQTLREHADYDPRSQRLVFLEKIRHGGFLGYGGNMPPFSAERLSDQDAADILEALGVLGL